MALGTVAVAAAGAGETAIGKMNNLDRKDATSAACAPKLAMTGKRDDANAVARMINNLDKRDRTLAELSKK